MTLQQLLGTELPIIQAPMAGVQGSALAVAVSEAGALGSLPCAMLGNDAIRSELAAIRAQTARPFNVNFFCHRQPAPDAARERAGAPRWRRTTPSSASTAARWPPGWRAGRSTPGRPTCSPSSRRRSSASTSGCRRPS